MLIHVINLDRTPERFTKFMAVNAGIADFRRVAAVDGNALDLGALAASGVTAPGVEEHYTRGALGCALSHFALWDQAIATNQITNVCEDDVIFNRHFVEYAAAVMKDARPGWHIILWGWNFGAILQFELLDGVSGCTAFFDDARMRANIAAFQDHSVTPRTFRLILAMGTLCYSISPAGALAAGSFCKPIRAMRLHSPPFVVDLPATGVDDMLSMAYPKQLNALVSFPPLVVTATEASASTIQRPARSIIHGPPMLVASARNEISPGASGESRFMAITHMPAHNSRHFGSGQQSARLMQLAPFLRAAASPHQRRELSLQFDARISPWLDCSQSAALPVIHSFYEVMSEGKSHHGLIAAATSMRIAGHQVRIWSYSPEKLVHLLPGGIDVSQADNVMPRALFERIIAGADARYFSDVFRYALLYEHGGLWMDTDVVLIRPFPFRGDYFFNLQWNGGRDGDFVCGNVIYARPHSYHLRILYEESLRRFFTSKTAFGEVGPKLLSEYLAFDKGKKLNDYLFSPMFFNSIDWTEIDKFHCQLPDLVEYLNDGRVIGVHLWNKLTNEQPRTGSQSLLSVLSNPKVALPELIQLADQFATDKNHITGNHHFYSRIYDRLLSSRRFSLRRLMEIGLCVPQAGAQDDVPSVRLWQTYFPYCSVVGVDKKDFSRFNDARFHALVCDQSKEAEIRAVSISI